MIGIFVGVTLVISVGFFGFVASICWAAARAPSRAILIASPIALHLFAIAYAVQSHMSLNNSDGAFGGGADAAGAAGILALYAAVAASFLLSLITLPFWLKRQNKLRIGN